MKISKLLFNVSSSSKRQRNRLLANHGGLRDQTRAWFFLLSVGLSACAGSTRVAKDVVHAANSCPEVMRLAGEGVTNWQRSLGIEAGDAATVKAAFDAVGVLGGHSNYIDARLTTICRKFGSDLGVPIEVGEATVACDQALNAFAKEKARLGNPVIESRMATRCAPDCTEPCDPAAPQGACARTSVAVTVTLGANSRVSRQPDTTEPTSIKPVGEAPEATYGPPSMDRDLSEPVATEPVGAAPAITNAPPRVYREFPESETVEPAGADPETTDGPPHVYREFPESDTTEPAGADPKDTERLRLAVEAFLSDLVVVRSMALNMKGAIAEASTAIERGIMTGRAISDGNVTSAVASALCLLPPMKRAEEHVRALRRDFRLMSLLAKQGGLNLPRLEITAEPGDPNTPAAPGERGAPPQAPAPVRGKVVRLLAFPEGGFAAQTADGRIAELSSGMPLMRLGRRGASPYCAAGPARRVVCLHSEDIFNEQGQRLGARLVVTDSRSGEVEPIRVAHPAMLMAAGIAFTRSGQLLYAYTLQDSRTTQTRVVRDQGQVTLPFVPKHGGMETWGGEGRVDPPITFFEFRDRQHLLYRDGGTLLVSPLDRPNAKVQVAENVSNDTRVVVGGDGNLYIFFFEPASRTARVAYSPDGWHFTQSVLDGRESGGQLEAISSEEGAVALFYYFRDTYRKGLRIAALKQGKLVRTPQAIVWEDRWNTGWHPHLASDGRRKIWLTYESRRGEPRVWSYFDSPSQLLASANGPKNIDEDYRNWFLQAGVGGWHTWWNLWPGKFDAHDLDGAELPSTTYKVAPTWLLSANFEARLGGIDLGLSYAQNYVEEKASELGVNRFLSGSIKLEDLLPGHDIKAEMLWGHYRGRVEQDSPAKEHLAETSQLDTNYIDTHLYALNQWRFKYGLGFSSYRLPTPIVAYYADKGQAGYSFATSALRDVSYYNIELALGWSKLDYLAKYENHYFGPIADMTIAPGLSFMNFDAITTPVGDVDNALAFQIRGHAKLGWLAMARARALSGLGFFVCPSYSIEYTLFTNGSSRPEARNVDETEESSIETAFMLHSLRHGVWLEAGVVW